MERIKRLVSQVLSRMGYTILQTSIISELEYISKLNTLTHFLSQSDLTANMPVRHVQNLIRTSKSQLGQDVLALSYVGTERPGYFVEFGATNGLVLSNTYILEKNYGWNGILCEPAKNWHRELRINRQSKIDTRCVFTSSGEELDFSESSSGGLSTLYEFVQSDSHSREISKSYKVTSVTLLDLLNDHQAPNFIDFISIDTEGSEYLILRDFDFEKYRFGLICVEHNYTDNRGKILELLSSKGYGRVFEKFSMWDDWYVSVE